MIEVQKHKWILRNAKTGEYLSEVDNNKLLFGSFEMVTHFDHPYDAWRVVKIHHLDPMQYQTQLILTKQSYAFGMDKKFIEGSKE